MNRRLRQLTGWQETVRWIIRLDTQSHVSAAPLGRTAKETTDDIGGRRPSGGIAYQDDRNPESTIRSADFYRRQLQRIERDHQQDLDRGRDQDTLLLRDGQRLNRLAEQAEESWTAVARTPIPAGDEPAYGSPQWKRYVAESVETDAALAWKFHVTKQYISQIRKAYRQAA
jgi:hypothetical protein